LKETAVKTIREVMNPRVVGIRPETTVGKAIEVLTQQHIGGLPVIDGEGAVVGMISELALIDVVFDPNVKDAPVSDYMNPEVHLVHPEDPMSRAAQLFALYSFRRLPVVENNKLVGIVTRRDLMNYALRTSTLLADPLIELIPELAPMS
jgi:tRNA nucleotidyltransferase (CCA-adding enzyme)